jgi:DNA-binding XRE family transcriptional regulator
MYFNNFQSILSPIPVDYQAYFYLYFYFRFVTFVTLTEFIMDKRLQQFLDAENISQTQLADTLGVTRAGISHILSGRNKPGFDFLEAMALHYPQISMDWLLTGKGRMYKEASASSGENPVFAGTPAPRRVSKILVFYDDNTFEEFQ